MHKITLVISGKKFITSRETLSKSTFFKRIINKKRKYRYKRSQKDKYWTINIDRDPKMFRLILNHLRGYTVILPKSESNLIMLLDDCRFYGVNNLTKRVEKHILDNKQDIISKYPNLIPNSELINSKPSASKSINIENKRKDEFNIENNQSELFNNVFKMFGGMMENMNINNNDNNDNNDNYDNYDSDNNINITNDQKNAENDDFESITNDINKKMSSD